MIHQAVLLIRTLSHLKPRQVVQLLAHRLPPSLAVPLPSGPIHRRMSIALVTAWCDRETSSGGTTFHFLNVTNAIPTERIDWVSRDMPKLWRYNLHYFDYLHDPQRSFENKCLLITDWIRSNPPGTEDAWEPYTASLRIVNWVKFFLSRAVAGLKESDRLPKHEWLESLYQQALWLEQNIEYHILANHYLKNGVALFFAGVYFEGVDADRWLQKGLGILRGELKEQFLADGGHFERSPMYHSICLVDYLDVLNLAENSSAAISSDIAGEFSGKVTAALDFLHAICLPDGAIPLFNDSAFGIAPPPHRIFDYAERVIGYKTPRPTKDLVVNAFPSNGYYVCRKADDMIIIDCGPIGPDYQPGHAHCDTLSYELAIDGRRVVVDSGVYDYELSRERAYARSTSAHNTVMVDEEEQSEMWGVFRVARRARPIQAHIDKAGEGSVLFEGAHDGYTRLKGRPIHKRKISYDGCGSWVVTDVLEGRGIHRMESFVHIHPDFTILESGEGPFRIERGWEIVAMIEALSPCRVQSGSGCYFPEFGLSRKNPVLAFSCSGEGPLQLSYRIQKTRNRQTQAHEHANPLSVTLLPSRG
ncbi:conserved hypothetical protein [Candidatus Nitrospira nitrificans]|uniref:Uncharacterized protein n=1 Tax=Candidatus Nitrospira nitrificans TaxID=1742973 RepID=A0A0S4L2I0_9BACT|nr:conserved hypothetical protein [Candidatus Nitrospira nitrificans]